MTNLRAKLMGAFALVLLLSAAESLLTYRTTLDNQSASNWVRHTQQVLATANLAQDSLTDMGLRYEEFLRTGDETVATAYLQDTQAYPAQLAALDALTADNPPQVARWNSIAHDADLLRTQVIDPGMDLRRRVTAGTASPEQLQQIDPTGQGEQAFSRIQTTFSAAIAVERDLLNERTNTADEANSTLLNVLTWGTLLTVVLGLAIAVLIATNIGQAMGRFARVSRSIAAGNLSQRIDLRRGDEIGHAAAAFDQMAAALEADRAARTRAQAHVEFLQKQTESILTSAAEGIFGQSPDGTCVMVNPAVSAMTGYAMDEMRGTRIHNLLHHSHADGTPYLFEDCPIASVQREGSAIQNMQDVFWRKDGSMFSVEFSAVPMIEDGRVTGIVVTFHDITERRAIERMKNEFISIASHELRTPLTSIRGSLGLVASGLLGPIPERADHMVKMAITNSDRLIRLINDILDIERIESGRSAMEIRPTHMPELIANSIESIAAAASDAQVSIVTDVEPLTVDADPDRIQQTLVNLLGNAIKFSEAHSTVTVAAHASGADVLISVHDTGRGIPRDKLSSIFERFQQVDSSDARQKGGTGLGLAISRSIIQQHGGRIWVESELGKGSTFLFTLPMMASERVEADQPQDSDRVSVMVCDDDPDVLEVVGEMLRAQGYRALAVLNGREAVERAAAEQPSAILLDLAMPGMDGWETLVALKGKAETRDIPVLILSGVERTGLEPAESAEAWISKPVRAETLHSMLEQALGRRPGPPRVLVVEDDPGLAGMLAKGLAATGVEAQHAATSDRAIALTREADPDLLLLDLTLASGSGLDVVDRMREREQLQRVPIVIYSGTTRSRIPPEVVRERVMALLRRAVPTH